MKYATRHGLANKLALGMLVAMAGEGAGGGAELLDFEQLNELDLDDIADLQINQIADAKGFVLPPIGMYRLALAVDFGEVGKEGQKKKAIVAEWTVREVIELQDAEATPPAVDTTFTTSWVIVKIKKRPTTRVSLSST
jgi:hypothetical protein